LNARYIVLLLSLACQAKSFRWILGNESPFYVLSTYWYVKMLRQFVEQNWVIFFPTQGLFVQNELRGNCLSKKKQKTNTNNNNKPFNHKFVLTLIFKRKPNELWRSKQNPKRYLFIFLILVCQNEKTVPCRIKLSKLLFIWLTCMDVKNQNIKSNWCFQIQKCW
jgi:hypothetical protein